MASSLSEASLQKLAPASQGDHDEMARKGSLVVATCEQCQKGERKVIISSIHSMMARRLTLWISAMGTVRSVMHAARGET
jgi:hypothetical protein